MMARRADQHGFALAAILWLLAGLTILVASVSTSLLAVSRTNRDAEDRLKLLLAEQRALADITYLTGTYKTLGAGVQVGSKILQIDSSTQYTLGEGGSVLLQDTLGLVALNSPGGDDVRRLAAVCGARSDHADALADALLDYTDADSLKRLSGAETFEYSAAGMQPPRNQPLAETKELWQVFGWKALQTDWQANGCDAYVSLAGNAQLNLWTAPSGVLQALGMTVAEAAAAIADRDLGRDKSLLSPYLMQYRNLNETGSLGGSRFGVRNRGQVRVTVMLDSVPFQRQVVLDRAGYNSLVPYTRSQYAWLPTPQLSKDGVVAKSAFRFTDNLPDFFLPQVGSSLNSNAQVPLLPIGQP